MSQEIDENEKINEIYCNYKIKIYKYALSYVKDSYLAEDITQEVFLKFLKNRHKFLGLCSLDTWIYTITKNQCIDYSRTNYAKKVSPSEELVLLVIEEKTPEGELITCGEIKELREKINILPSIYKEVIYLYYLCDLSLNEIQYKLNLNLSTVKTRIHRGKQLLNLMYKQEKRTAEELLPLK